MFSKREDESIRPAGPPHAASPTGFAARREHEVAIGPSICIVGDVTGNEDLTILGRVRGGKIDVPQHTVTVGEAGHIDADVHAKVVIVAGEVHGNLMASEQILLRNTATMLGNLNAPRVAVEEGCRFCGSVDMEVQPEKGQTASAPTSRTPGAAALATRDEPVEQQACSPRGIMSARLEG